MAASRSSPNAEPGSTPSGARKPGQPSVRVAELLDNLEARAAPLEEQLSRLAEMAKSLGAVEVRDAAREVAGAVEAAASDLRAAGPDARAELEARLSRAAAQAAKLLAGACERLAREMEPFRVEVGQAILSSLASGGRERDAFELADRGRSGALGREEFLAFVSEHSGRELSAEQLGRLFDFLDDDGDGRLSRDEFMRCILILYRVSRPNVDLCHTMGLTQGRLVRRLDLNEIVELVEGPVQESNRAVRIRCRSARDGAVGWAMSAGSSGVVFVQQTRVHFQVKVATSLTTSCALEGCSTLRRLREGELLEVLLWERPDGASGLRRLKGRALRDGAVGWATAVGSGGTVHLQPV